MLHMIRVVLWQCHVSLGETPRFRAATCHHPVDNHRNGARWLQGVNMILDTGSDKFVAKTWATIKAELEKIDAGASEDVFPGGEGWLRQ